jgi:phage gp46-like protein
MSDIALAWTGNVMDAVLSGADLLGEDALETAVALSLFCDARLPEGHALIDGSDDRRGWWADQFAETEGDSTGSLLWTLRREKRVPETLERARQYAQSALAWMIEDGIAARVHVRTSFISAAQLSDGARFPNEHFLIIEIDIDRPSGTSSFRWEYNWQQQLAKRA